MRATNQFYDKLLIAMKHSNPAQRLTDAKALVEDNGYSFVKEISQRELWQAAPTTEEVIAVYSHYHYQTVAGLKATMRRDLYRQVVRLIALLADAKHGNGYLPQRLKELRSGPDSQPLPASLLLDPFSGRELEYHALDGGFVLRSVGYNQVRDESEFLELQAKRREYPEEDQDLVWRWLPGEE